MFNRMHKLAHPFRQPMGRVPIYFKCHCHCWKCDHNTSNLFCPSCNSLQKPNKNDNYFRVLGIDVDYNVNEIAMSQKFKNLQKLLHPDKFSNKSESEQKVSDEYSSLVNKAYSTLLNPLSRGIYMLNLKGVEISEDTQLESKFLHDIMERNEQVENADKPDEILRIEKENSEIIKLLQNELGNSLKRGDVTESKNIIIRMKYYDSINNQIKIMITKMRIVK